jgi:putative membrane protein
VNETTPGRDTAADPGSDYRSPIAVASWVLVFLGTFAWSAIGPKDYPTWALEVFPAVAAFVLIACTWRRFPLTPLLYWLILVHAVILMVGGHYTYADVPAGEWFRELTGGVRNNYDKLGHIVQGFVPAILAREILLRRGVLNKTKGWLGLFVVSICLAFSALYEMLEWWVAIAAGLAADAFLGTQGYAWDTQSDMFLAMVGAVAALVLLGRVHDRQIRRISQVHIPGAA